MAYKQLIGSQGKSRFTLLQKPNIGLKSFVIENTAPTIKFTPVNDLVENFRGEEILGEGGYKIMLDFVFYNIQNTHIVIDQLLDALNMLKRSPSRLELMIAPNYREYEEIWEIKCLPSGNLSVENVKEFMNTAQSITLNFVSKHPVFDYPRIFNDPGYLPVIPIEAQTDLRSVY